RSRTSPPGPAPHHASSSEPCRIPPPEVVSFRLSMSPPSWRRPCRFGPFIEQPAGQIDRNRQLPLCASLTRIALHSGRWPMEPPLHSMEPPLQAGAAVRRLVSSGTSWFQVVVPEEVHELLVFPRRQVEEREDATVVAHRFAEPASHDRLHLSAVQIPFEKRLADDGPEVLAAAHHAVVAAVARVVAAGRAGIEQRAE